MSQKTLYNKIAAFPNPDDFKKHSAITEAQLEVTVRRIKEEYPNDEEIMVAGHLLKQGIRVQCAKLRIDPHGVVERISVAVRRREYHAKGPNEVWHIDGHHKLIKWRLVTRGGIDGHSRMITYLHCSSNSRAEHLWRDVRWSRIPSSSISLNRLP